MIQVISRQNSDQHGKVTQSFFALRQRVFTQRLGWRNNAHTDSEYLEQDEFDSADAIYMVIENDADEVVAGLRLLNTCGRYLLGDVFPQMLCGAIPRDGHIYEVTRFVVDPCRQRRGNDDKLVSQLVWGLQRYGLMTGLSRYVSLSYLGMERILRANGCRFHRLGAPQLIDGRVSVALEFEISEEICARLEARVSQLHGRSAPDHANQRRNGTPIGITLVHPSSDTSLAATMPEIAEPKRNAASTASPRERAAPAAVLAWVS